VLADLGSRRIAYSVSGDPDGLPVLAIAPGGMRSAAALWGRSPYNPLERLDRYRVIAMDQRNAGGSWAPIGERDGWEVYTEDQLALLDHLGVDRFHVVGMCIGGTHATRLLRAAPKRALSAVLMQPIGLAANRDAFFALFDAWAVDVAPAHPEATPAAFAALRDAMFGGDFQFGAGRDDVAELSQPVLVLMGDDLYHPSAVSREIAALAPKATLVERWKDDPAATDQLVQAFLAICS
jgi:pimeloyl-ACP methyl ester carboxylesterase